MNDQNLKNILSEDPLFHDLTNPNQLSQKITSLKSDLKQINSRLYNLEMDPKYGDFSYGKSSSLS